MSHATDDGMPLVSIVITAYNPRFFRATLASALAQSWSPLEIVIGDDCVDDGIERITRELGGSNPAVRYRRNSPALGGPDNRIACFDRARGTFIKFLNDDDLLHPECVRRMAACLAAFPQVSLVTSHRTRIDADGASLADDPATERPVRADAIVDGRRALARMLDRQLNFVGEPSTVMFRREQLADAEPHILSFAGRACIPNGDVTMWSHLLTRGDLLYLVDSLSSFRIHGEQMQRRPGYREVALEAWDQLRGDAERLGVLDRSAWKPEPLGVRPWWPAEVLRQIADANDAVECGELGQAEAHLARALEEIGPDVWLLTTRANVLRALGRETEAALAYEHACRVSALPA